MSTSSSDHQFIIDDDEDVVLLDDDSSSNSDENQKLTISEINSMREQRWLTMNKEIRPYSFKDDKSSPWFEERQVIVTLLNARIALRELIQAKMNEERLSSGNLCVSEIQSLLNKQKEDIETDWIAEIQELKRNMIAEIRRNHLLERDLTKLDKRIALLIKHRSNIKELLASEEKKKSKKKKTDGNENVNLDGKQIESYQNLFYLLQTEPHYLAKLVTQVQADQMDSFLDTVILTLFGDAFSPREEFLILSLFRLAIGQEMSGIKSAGDLISVDSVVPKMIITYTRRKQGHEFLNQIIAPILENHVINAPDLNLELNAVQIYQNMISEQEIQTGAKSTMNRGLAEEQILQLKEVQDILAPRVEKCIQICELFFKGIIESLNRLPYGIRWICKQIHSISKQNFESTSDEIAKVIGYFVYYRFMNLAIVTPDAFEIIKKELSMNSRKNLVNIAKVLQHLFTLKTFQNQGGERWMQPLNTWILSRTDMVRQYFDDLIQVTDPSEYLRVDKYNELTLKLNPVVVVTLGEISQTHHLLMTNLKFLKMKDKEDPLEMILKSLPPPLEVSEENDREIQLTLTNRFKEHMEREISTSASLLAETKELVLQVFRSIPIQSKKSADSKDDFVAILKGAALHGQQTGNAQLTANSEKIIENLKKMENEGTITPTNQYEGFIRMIALEVINRQEIREHQRKERMRLTIALRDLRKHQSYLNEQIQHYTSYLKDVLAHYSSKDKKKANKPVKMSYKELTKKGIIVESDIPKISHGATNFYISTDTPGIFDIEAKIGIATAGSITLELDDLLEKASAGIPVLKLENIVLDKMVNLRGCMVGGVILAAVGIAAFVISLALIPSVVKKVGENAVAENVIVSSSSSSYYDNWLGQSSIDNYFLQYYYAYNLTNPEEVLAGGVANYSQIGPFNYKYEWNYTDVSFADNGNQATYTQTKTYIFDLNNNELSEDMMITNINPAYLGLTQTLVSQNAKASIFLNVIPFPGIPVTLKSLNSQPVLNFINAYNGIPAFQSSLTALLGQIGNDIQTFYTNWANSTTLPADGNWNGMLTSLNAQVGSGISSVSAAIIFNSTDSLSLLNTQGMLTWFNAYSGDATSASNLMNGTGITQAQLQIVGQWFYSTFAEAVTAKAILQTCNITDASMIAFCQLYNGTLLNQNSITSFNFIGNPFNGSTPVEFLGFDPSTNITMPVFYDICFNSGNVSLSTGNGGLTFLLMSLGQAPNVWNLDASTINVLGNAIGNVIPTAFIYKYFSQLLKNNGLIVTKSAYDWLWGCNDPILDFLSAPNPCALQVNNTVAQPTTIHTGKDDNLLTNFLIKWQGQTQLNFWGPPAVNVTGYTESGQFAPNQGLMETLTIFEENVFRPVTLNYHNDTSVHDIKTRRYYLQNDSFPASPDIFYTQYDGFANLTALQQGVPTFVTLWDMWEVPTNISSRVNGMNPSYENAAIPLDLEPTSGNALYYNLKLQVNFLYENNGWDDTFAFFTNVTNGIYYPSWKIGQTATPSDKTLDNLAKQLKQLRELKIVPVVVMALVGSLMFVAGVVMVVISAVRHRRLNGYESINST
ncbi:RasGTPase-activating protein [Heterostelium album PN500]|uniref:RasGTPase-activating protein n=1 Tax=Heterostelium pallidum (strain ATCC 26659 / Pp 5 / PN500) TaxID=670386 RepID=D3BAY2_HETP5|nr:RasGTPase-activating protein [Heterostelium album PN500]EFA81719.1 RasGTPase-activating protein [Heterostelium album PN500]|eukprot:XP_020433836.1 RasGTPase-activating protein [Heterostelium album PN500]